ncbi:MAG: crossover junction endodeoxyribonuclease RuvC [Bacillota bacterium]
MIILGIDPGTATTGYGLIKVVGNKYKLLDYGCIRTPAHTPMPKRLKMIYTAMCRLLDENKPDQLAIEQLFFNSNTTTAISVGQARGVLVLAAAQRQIPVGEYTPLQVKQSIVGYGQAEKHQVKYMVGRFLNMKEPPRSDDAADALAIAICHSHYYQSRKMIVREE